MSDYHAIILGAGAAGLFCAGHAARGGRVLILDHAKAPGEKIRISGGGRCNFTNMHCGPANFLSQNPHFAKSALARYTQWDFIDLVSRHGIAWHEKTLGQLFCDGSAREIIAMLLAELNGADLRLQTSVEDIAHSDGTFTLRLSDGRQATTRHLVVATGGKSIPKMGASGFGYRVAEQFGLPLIETRAGLVPLTFGPQDLEWMKPLAGLSLPARVSAGGASFDEAALFTHRGLSGPSILQISNYWREGEDISLDLLKNGDAFDLLRRKRAENGRRNTATVLADLLPSRLAAALAVQLHLSGNIADQSDAALRALVDNLRAFTLRPTGTEGYRTAEVTLGGVDTDALDARTMQAKSVPGLYFIGEVVDVTGWLGGFNFQWAWSSAHAAGTAIAAA